MNRSVLLSLTAATLVVVCAGLLSRHARTQTGVAQAPTVNHVVGLATVSVRPDPADLAHFHATQAQRVVDLPAVKVAPDMADLAYFQAARAAERIVDLGTVTVRPAAGDLAWYLSQQAGQIAVQAQWVDARLAAGAGSLVGDVAPARSLSGFGGRGENSAARGKIFADSPPHSGSMGQEATEIWTARPDLQPGRPKSDRLLGPCRTRARHAPPHRAAAANGTGAARPLDLPGPGPAFAHMHPHRFPAMRAATTSEACAA